MTPIGKGVYSGSFAQAFLDSISPGQFRSLDIITVELFYSLSSSPTHTAVFCDKKGLNHSGHCLISSSGFTRKDVCVQKVEYIYKMLSHALSSCASVCTAEQHTFYSSQRCEITGFKGIIIIQALLNESHFSFLLLHTAYYPHQLTPKRFCNFPSVQTERAYFFSFLLVHEGCSC